MATILVVEDSRVDQSLVEGILTSGGDFNVCFASHGIEALASIKAARPDLVVTDLMMPEMDGLQLVKSIRQHHARIPVIVMTSVGTEETAIEALQLGAASFVPKARLSDRLRDTVHQVLALIHVDHPYGDVLHCLSDAHLNFRLASKLSLIPQVVDLTQRSIASMEMCDATESIRLSLALEEALLNALVHGNLELTAEVSESGLQPHAAYFKQRTQEPPYKDRKICINMDLSTAHVTFVVRDEGRGFDAGKLLYADDLRPFQSGWGRGLRLMRSFMDEVGYNDLGNEVTLKKYFGLSGETTES